MKYSQRIGIAATVALMAVCFLPWSFIASQQTTISGFFSKGVNSFGKPGLMNFSLAVIMLVLFAVPAIWAKRLNVFIAALNLAWAARNYIIISSCMMGECPEKKIGIFLLIVLSIVIQVMALLPKINVVKK